MTRPSSPSKSSLWDRPAAPICVSLSSNPNVRWRYSIAAAASSYRRYGETRGYPGGGVDIRSGYRPGETAANELRRERGIDEPRNAEREPRFSAGPAFTNDQSTGRERRFALHRAGCGLPSGLDRRAHDGVVLPLGTHVGEAGLLEQAAGDAVEERRGDLLAAGVLGVGLDHAAAGRGDQVE